MASINNLKQNKNKFNTLEYQKCVLEGMSEWLDLKCQTGNMEIGNSRILLNKEIKKNKEINVGALSQIVSKMKSLGINKETRKEFKGIFKVKI